MRFSILLPLPSVHVIWNNLFLQGFIHGLELILSWEDLIIHMTQKVFHLLDDQQL